MWFLRGAVAALVSPLGTALVLWAVALLCLMLGRPRGGWRRLGVLAGAAGWLWLAVWSTPVASHALRARLELHAGPRAVQDVPAAAVAVVLGGGMGGARSRARPYPDMLEAADRLWHAARLYRAGKAPLLLLSGGTTRADEGPEAVAMQALLRDLGVPESALLLESRSTTTGENARFSAPMLRERGVDTVLLVTSALHMRRARAEFERAGLKVLPAPTDFESLGRQTVPRDWLPQTEALDGSARAFKEWVGFWLLGR